MYCTSKRSILLSILIQYVSLDRSAVAFSQFGMQSSIARSGRRSSKALWVSRITEEEEMLDSAVTVNNDDDSTKSGSVSKALWVLRGKEVEMLGSAVVAPKQDNDVGSFPQGKIADFENWLEEEHKEWEEQQKLPVSNEKEGRSNESLDFIKEPKKSFVTGITSLCESFFNKNNKSPTTKKQKHKKRTNATPAISFEEEDLMLMMKFIQHHADRSSTTVPTEQQYIQQQQKAVLGVVGKQQEKPQTTTDVSVPYDAAALLAYEKAGSPGDDFDAYKQRYEAAMVEMVKSKKAGMSVNTVLRSFGIPDSSKAKP